MESEFLRSACEHDDENVKGVACCFKDIHDLCWKIWGVLGEFGQQDVWKGFRNPENREKIAEFIGEMKQIDKKAIEYLRLVVEGR